MASLRMPKAIRISSKAIQWAKNASLIRLSNRIKKKKIIKRAINGFKQGWREIAGRRIYFRSKWEANYGMYLQFQKEKSLIKDWEHEPKTFWFEGVKRGCVSYLPDFKLTHFDGSHEWIEVKGYMDAKSLTKIKRFKKYYPEEKLKVVDSKWYKANKTKLSSIVKGWEK